MTKKEPRSVPAESPRYPRFEEMDRRTFLDWGIAALGVLVVGGPLGCKKERLGGDIVTSGLGDAGHAGEPSGVPGPPPGAPPLRTAEESARDAGDPPAPDAGRHQKKGMLGGWDLPKF